MDFNPFEVAEDCLDIAIDHRLRPLFKPITKRARPDIGSPGLRLDHLTKVNPQRIISEAEVRITNRLFNAEWSGGITAILLQPANSHPYQKGLSSVIEACPTYCFLNEGFKAVTCGTLWLGDGTLSIIDSAPFVRPWDDVSVECKRQMRRQTSHSIHAKKPDVVLCMWQDKEGVTSAMSEVQSLGIGKDFISSSTSLNGEPLKRVNSFHPSYAANYISHASCFRQLLLLNIAQACSIYVDGMWHEKEWMKELKKRCAAEASSMSKMDQSNLQYIVDHLQLQLRRIQDFFNFRLSTNAASQGTYDDILRSRLSENFADAGLCLRNLWIHDYRIHPEDISDDDRARICSGGRKCLRLLRRIVSNSFGYRPTQAGGLLGYYDPNDLTKHLSQSETTLLHISGIAKRFLKGLNSTISVQANDECKIDLLEASKIFLSAAVRVEGLLAELKDSTGSAPDINGVEQGVATMKI